MRKNTARGGGRSHQMHPSDRSKESTTGDWWIGSGTGTEVVVSRGWSSRLDVFLRDRLSGISRRQSRKLFVTATVTINGRRAGKGEIVRPGDIVRIVLHESIGDLLPQPDLPVRILYEDPFIVAMDKPSGMPSLALRWSDRDTVANYLIARYPETTRVGAPLEAGVVHRLDTGTSGVLLAARTAEVHALLRQQFRRLEIHKRYLALVRGDVTKRGVIRVPIAHSPRQPRRMCVCPNPQRGRHLGARPAETRYRPLARLASASLLAVSISTGVRHQIRLHLASIGHPVLGDPLYDPAPHPPADVPRTMLHACRIGFRHPVRDTTLLVEAPLPSDFRAVIRCLE